MIQPAGGAQEALADTWPRWPDRGVSELDDGRLMISREGAAFRLIGRRGFTSIRWAEVSWTGFETDPLTQPEEDPGFALRPSWRGLGAIWTCAAWNGLDLGRPDDERPGQCAGDVFAAVP